MNENDTQVNMLVGQKLRELRGRKGLSLRALADRSGLNVNTLSLIENGKSSPSVSTLQRLAQALEVPIVTFFESEPVKKRVVFTPADQRPLATLGETLIQNLGKDLADSAIQPFVVTVKPGVGSGDQMIVHTGHEFVYCLDGTIRYRIEQEVYILKPGDSLVFEAHLPHCWENHGDETAQILIIFSPLDVREEPGGRHFTPRVIKKELTMKIAVVTDDGKTISRHFGRAPYYLVVTIEEGKIVNRELRDKVGHNQYASHPHGQAEAANAAGHGMDSTSHDKHIRMAETIADCAVLLCGGMGRGAYESMRRLNIQPVITDLSDIDTAIEAFLRGELVDHPEWLH